MWLLRRRVILIKAPESVLQTSKLNIRGPKCECRHYHEERATATLGLPRLRMMGEKNRKQVNDRAFREMYPTCAYCGKPTQTVDHFPPRAAFRNRDWPDEYRFPSCVECNSSTSQSEQVVSALVRMRLDGAMDDEYTLKLLKGIKNNQRDVMGEWFAPISRNEIRRSFRSSFGPEMGDELRRRGFNMISYGPKTQAAIEIFGIKLALALYYKHFERHADGPVFCLPLSAIRNREALRTAADHAPFVQHTTHRTVSLSDQFVYRYNASSDLGVLFVIVQLGPQLAFLCHAFSQGFVDTVTQDNPNALRQVKDFYARTKASAESG